MAALDILSPRRAPAVDPGGLVWLPRLGPVRLRPLQAADWAAYDAFGAKLDSGDLRLRFAGAVRFDSPIFAAQFRRIDHDEVEAFAAFNAGGEILGVGHLVRLAPDVAEVALIVRSDLKRRGLGRSLLDRMVRHARGLGLAELTGQILGENRPMLRLAQEAGFRVVASSGVMVELRKDLRPPPRRSGAPS